VRRQDDTSAAGERRDRTLEGGWCLQAVGKAQRSIRIVIGDTELAAAFPGIVAGRDPALCDRVLDDPTISRRHCRFSVREERLFVEDLNSLNGTLLGKEDLAPFRPAPVLAAQTISLGRLTMTVRRLGPEVEHQ
jgi:hypothetical protein